MSVSYILVTGCDSGFGRSTVELLVKSVPSAKIFACYHTTWIPLGSSRIIPIQIDITSDTSVENTLSMVRKELDSNDGQLIGLVNNAGGLVTAGPAEWSSIEDDVSQMNLNYIGSVRVTKKFLPLIRRSRGRVVFVSSILGLIASPLGAAYSASKFAIEGWADALRREMTSFGVSVHIVEPGMFLGTSFYDGYDQLVQRSIVSTPGDVIAEYGGDMYGAYCQNRLVRLRDVFGNKNFQVVSHAILHALISRWPKTRYRIGTDCAWIPRIIEWLPTTIGDLALTVTDWIILRDMSMFPVVPRTSPFHHWIEMIPWAFARYQQTWLLLGILIVFMLVLV
jgi:NAD(P)-dependent dehydrogenase (short-subunit alcohol dehydrogenase family)